MQNRSRTRPILLAGLLLLGSLIATGSGALAAKEATPVPELSQTQEIENLLASCDAIFGVVIIDPDDQVVFEENADLPFVSASLYKLVLLANILAGVDRGS